ncbi:hypothetical protein PI95_031815 [Hassallia byssoidea VB512170]|uniref:KGK family protein n=1 Tax=Hassallia byssoidea VB512170 TaxID=1304833 RepID=A0A846HHZ7_9CYAN|nr:KGK domain-containing protein [Hassalia byssoidea]NEU76962.1 hypothetical protein [Hassalia byssoidea VB512170]
MSLDKSVTKTSTAKVSEIRTSLIGYYLQPCNQRWLSSGVDCEVLLVNGGKWRKGKIRLRFEFVPNELAQPQSESPLDEFRQLEEMITNFVP